MADIGDLDTEKRNSRSQFLDRMTPLEIVTLMNEEDASIAGAVRLSLPCIAEAVDLIIDALTSGGRLIYVGAGTSGRLAVLDASECPPTFGVGEGEVVAVMAGGPAAFIKAVEGSEDDGAAAADDLKRIGLDPRDAVVGISASGRTPYVKAALELARSVGAGCVALSCNSPAEISPLADVAIEVATGPEVLTGSTRLKAGTAQKMVLNMLTTASFVRLGKIYENLMVDVSATNDKLVDRARRILVEAAGVSHEDASLALKAAGGNAKIALVMLKTGMTSREASVLLDKAGGQVRTAIGED
jgi:N-acetylmuramic acid 6-phosphate etherase